MAIPFESAIDFTNQFDGYFLVRVAMRIAHVRALIDEHVIQNSAVAFLNVAEFLGEFREILQVVAIDLCVIGDVFRLVAVMGRSMPAATEAGFGEVLSRQIAAQHECDGTRNVAFEGQRHQVVHQTVMQVLAFRQSKRNVGTRLLRGIRHCNFDPAFQFSNVFRVGIETRFIARAEIFL